MARIALTALALLGLLAVSHATEATSVAVADYYEGYGGDKYGSYVPKYDSSKDTKGGYYQKPFVTCPDQYAFKKSVTAIRYCQDDKGFISGIQYFNIHPYKHYDPVTMCMTDGMPNCKYFELPIDEGTGRTATIVNMKVAKMNDEGDWKIVYMSFGFSSGAGLDIGYLNPDFLSILKVYQWNQEHKPGMICGLNGFYNYGFICDKHTGYLTFVTPCYSCDKKPKAKPRSYKVTKVYEPVPMPGPYDPYARNN